MKTTCEKISKKKYKVGISNDRKQLAWAFITFIYRELTWLAICRARASILDPDSDIILAA